MKRTKSAVWSGAALAVTLLAAGSPALAQGVSCGDVLAPGTVTTLTADLECPFGGVILTVDSATLLLNGFSLICTYDDRQAHGVRLVGKHAALIGPGNIIGCDPGVLGIGEGKHVVNGVHVDSAQGIAIDLLSDKNLVTHSTVSGQDGIRLYGDKNRIIENEATTNGDGIDVFGSRNRLESNQLTGNTDAIQLRASKNKASDNTVTDAGYGVTVDGDGQNVSGNQITSAEFYGIRVLGGARILANTITGSGGTGIDVSSPADAKVKVSGNEVTGNAVDLLDATAGCGEHKWSGNVFGTASPASCVQ